MTPLAIERWEHVVKSRDLDLLDQLLADDVVFESPVVHTPQVGRAITGAYLAAALQVLNSPEFRYIRRWLGVDDAATKLRIEWIPKFEQVLGEKKAAIFFQIDRRVGLMMEIQLASALPLIRP